MYFSGSLPNAPSGYLKPKSPPVLFPFQHLPPLQFLQQQCFDFLRARLQAAGFFIVFENFGVGKLGVQIGLFGFQRGDYISADNPHWASQRWIERIHMAQAFADCVNRHGGDASVVRLPDIGIRGNSHFAFAEANNVEIADVLENWLVEKGLK